MKRKGVTKKDELFITCLCIAMVVLYFLVVVVLGSVMFK